MLQSEKLTSILQSWLAYIRLEELTQAEVEKSSSFDSKIIDKGVQILDNKLWLDDEIFKLFQEEQRLAVKNRRSQDFQIALAFPKICLVVGKIKEQKLKHLPLFTIDISPIFQGKYHKSGWDLTQFDFQPIVVNLMRLYKLEEEQAESVVVASGILSFLEDTFKGRFKTIQDFISLVDLPEGKYRNWRSSYLLRCDFTPYNALLKSDLQEILELYRSNSPDLDKLFGKGSLPFQYLFGRSGDSLSPHFPRQQLQLGGAFPSHAPDEYQTSVLQSASQNSLTAICGPPGTGKTEVFLHLIAQQVVTRALALIRGQKDENHLVVFASTNNSAVDKLISRLSDKRLYLPGGNQSIIRRETLPKLQATQDRLKNTEFNKECWWQAKLELEIANTKVRTNIEQQHLKELERTTYQKRLSQIAPQIESLQRDLDAKNVKLQALIQHLSELGDYTDFPLLAYQEIQLELERTAKELPQDSDSIGKRAINLFYSTTDKVVFNRLANRTRAAYLNALATTHRLQIPLERSSLSEARSAVRQALERYRQWQDLPERINRLTSQIAAGDRSIELLQADYRRIETQINAESQNRNAPQSERSHFDLQVTLFELGRFCNKRFCDVKKASCKL